APAAGAALAAQARDRRPLGQQRERVDAAGGLAERHDPADETGRRHQAGAVRPAGERRGAGRHPPGTQVDVVGVRTAHGLVTVRSAAVDIVDAATLADVATAAAAIEALAPGTGGGALVVDLRDVAPAATDRCRA